MLLSAHGESKLGYKYKLREVEWRDGLWNKSEGVLSIEEEKEV